MESEQLQARVDRLRLRLKKNFDPNQPRDRMGQWTAGGGEDKLDRALAVTAWIEADEALGRAARNAPSLQAAASAVEAVKEAVARRGEEAFEAADMALARAFQQVPLLRSHYDDPSLSLEHKTKLGVFIQALRRAAANREMSLDEEKVIQGRPGHQRPLLKVSGGEGKKPVEDEEELAKQIRDRLTEDNFTIIEGDKDKKLPEDDGYPDELIPDDLFSEDKVEKEFDESKHPRDDHGRWTEGAGLPSEIKTPVVGGFRGVKSSYRQQFPKGFSAKQTNASQLYATTFYRPLNKYLRGERSEQDILERGDDIARYKDTIEHLDSTFVPTQKDVVLWRGMGTNEDRFKKFLSSESFSDEGYVSASTWLNAALSFTMLAPPSSKLVSLVMKIVVPKGTKLSVPSVVSASDLPPLLSGIGLLEREREILLPRGVSFKPIAYSVRRLKKEGAPVIAHVMTAKLEPPLRKWWPLDKQDVDARFTEDNFTIIEGDKDKKLPEDDGYPDELIPDDLFSDKVEKEYDESKHPRDDHGRWTEGAGLPTEVKTPTVGGFRRIKGSYQEQFSQGFSGEQITAADDYAGIYYSSVNRYLRKEIAREALTREALQGGPKALKLLTKIEDIIKHLDSTFIPTQKDVVLWRGMGTNEDRFKKFLSSESFSDDGFVSASTLFKTALAFTMSTFSVGLGAPLLMKIIAPKGTRLSVPSAISSRVAENMGYEREVLLPRGTVFKPIAYRKLDLKRRLQHVPEELVEQRKNVHVLTAKVELPEVTKLEYRIDQLWGRLGIVVKQSASNIEGTLHIPSFNWERRQRKRKRRNLSKDFDPDQLREPKGSPTGGRWRSLGGSAGRQVAAAVGGRAVALRAASTLAASWVNATIKKLVARSEERLPELSGRAAGWVKDPKNVKFAVTQAITGVLGQLGLEDVTANELVKMRVENLANDLQVSKGQAKRMMIMATRKLKELRAKELLRRRRKLSKAKDDEDDAVMQGLDELLKALEALDTDDDDEVKKAETVSKAEADYQDQPKDGNQCAGCTMFRSPDSCIYVEGDISPEGWCRHFETKDVEKVAPRSLYVCRYVQNGEDIVKWAKAQGFKTTLPADDLHVTVAFSKKPVDWDKMGGAFHNEVEVPQGPRQVHSLGDEGAVVLRFNSDELAQRHRQIRDKGASWDHDGYRPHVTISWDAEGMDLDLVEPYAGKIVLGEEVFQEIKEDWKDNIVEKEQPDTHEFELVKVDKNLGLVFGWAVVCKRDGQDYYDLNIDRHSGERVPEHIPESTMLEAAADFMEHSRVAKEMHAGEGKGTFVFAFPLTTDIAKAMGIQSRTTGLMVAMKPSKELFGKFASGELTGFSIGGSKLKVEDFED